MRVVIQRVSQASVSVDKKIVGKIGHGLLIFLAVGTGDTEKDADYLAQKIVQLRIFEDEAGKMNLSAFDVKGAGLLVISQFTLYGDCRQGRRPSFDKAADPVKGEDLYNYFVAALRGQGLEVQTGVFQAMMDVSLINDGPVTFILDSPCVS